MPTSEPFDAAPRLIHMGRLDSEWTYAFNFETPNGVTLLGNSAGSRLNEILGRSGDSITACPEVDQLLERRGLVSRKDSRESVSQTATRKSFNVWLHLVNACNFRCHYCYIPHLSKEIDPQTIERLSIREESIFPILTRLFSFCERNSIELLHIKFAGGEPTLNLPLLEQFCSEAVKYASKVRVSFGMISNGSFQADSLIPILQTFSFKLSISIDGFEASHDRIRFSVDSSSGARNGSWKIIAANVVRLMAEGIRPYFLFTATAQNYRDLKAFASFCHTQSLGFRLSLVRSTIPPQDQLLESVGSYLCDFYEQLGKSMPLNLRFERDAKFAEWNLSKKKTLACGSCRNYVAIDQNGFVSSCQMTLDKPHGNLLREDLSSIMHEFKRSADTALLATPATKRGPCLRCRYFHVCAGGCPQNTFQTFDTFDHVSPWCRVYGRLAPVYIEAVARHLLRQLLAAKVANA